MAIQTRFVGNSETGVRETIAVRLKARYQKHTMVSCNLRANFEASRHEQKPHFWLF